MTGPGPQGRPAPGEPPEVRPLTALDEPRVLDLLTASLAGGPTGERTAEFFRWKHRDGVFGPSPGLVAVSGDRIVGVRLFLRWEFTAAGATVRAVRPVDTATHPEFRGRGIFRELTLELLDRVSGTCDLVFNTPGSRSLPGYLAMGWRPVGALPIAIRPARPAAFARGLPGQLARPRGGPPRPSGEGAGPAQAALRCSLPSAADVLKQATGLDALLQARASADRAARPARIGTARTPEFLRWRYAEAPGLDYRAITVERGGALAGIAFGRPRRRGSLTEFTLSDLVVRPGDRGTAAGLLRAAAGSGCDHVAAHLPRGTEARGAGPRCGYLPAPRTGITLVARRLTDHPGGLDPLRLPSWRFALGDLEVF